MDASPVGDDEFRGNLEEFSWQAHRKPCEAAAGRYLYYLAGSLHKTAGRSPRFPIRPRRANPRLFVRIVSSVLQARGYTSLMFSKVSEGQRR